MRNETSGIIRVKTKALIAERITFIHAVLPLFTFLKRRAVCAAVVHCNKFFLLITSLYSVLIMALRLIQASYKRKDRDKINRKNALRIDFKAGMSFSPDTISTALLDILVKRGTPRDMISSRVHLVASVGKKIKPIAKMKTNAGGNKERRKLSNIFQWSIQLKP